MKKDHFPTVNAEKITVREIFYSFMVILPAAFLFSLKNDLPHVFIITFALLLLPFFRKRPLPAKDRPIIYCIVAGMVLTALPDLMSTVDEARMGLFDILIRSTLVLPFLVYMASLGGLFAQSGRIVGMRAALALAGMLLCGDRFNNRDAHNIFLGFLDPLLKEYFSVYLVCAVLQGVFLPFFLCGAYHRKRGKEERTRKEVFLRKTAIFLQVFFIACFLFTSGISYHFLQKNPEFLRKVEIYFMRLGSRGMHRGVNRGKNMLPGKVDLRAPLPPWFGQLPDQILFHVKSSFPPGLMRSGVYTFYEHGRWLPQRKEKDIPLESVRRTGLLSFNTFRLSHPDITEFRQKNPQYDMENALPWEKEDRKMEFFPDSLISGGIVPMPGNVVRIDAVADSAKVTSDGILLLKHWKMDGGVTFFVREADGEAPFNIFLEKDEKSRKNIYGEILLPEEEKNLLTVPQEIREYTLKMLPQCKEKTNTEEGKIAVVEKFLRNNFTYSLHVPYTGKKDFFKDPVLRFLLDTKKGHCELFASAAVLMCRSLGLPARYVTGFVCEEKSPAGKYYICRLAHAWAEIYLPGKKAWMTLDPTPGAEIALRRERKEKNIYQKMMEYLKFSGKSFFAAVRRGYFAETLAKLPLFFWQVLQQLFRTVWGGGIVMAGCIIAGIWWQKRRRRKKKRADLTEERKYIREKWMKFEKEFSLLAGRKRPGEMTGKEFYSSFDLPGLKEIFEEYEKYRFGSPESSYNMLLLQKWEENMQKLLSFMKKKGAKNGKRK